jgi:L-ribulose-5-phosphate 3-epimerase UlaE
MILFVKYKSGETRRVNLTEDFFKSQDTSVHKRANDLAKAHGADIYQIYVTRGNEIVFENTYSKNAPEEAENNSWMNVDETKIKKTLRKQFKNVPFTQKYKL